MSVEAALRATDVFHHRFHSSCDDGTTLVHFRCERENGGGEDGGGGRHAQREYSDLHVVARPPAAGGSAPPSPAPPSPPPCGVKLWPCGFVLAQFVARFRRQFVAGKSVLELGAGVGLPGLVAALGERRDDADVAAAPRAAAESVDGVDGGGGDGAASRVHLSDNNPTIVALLELNLALNGLAAGGTAPPPPRPASRADDDGGGGDAARAGARPPCQCSAGLLDWAADSADLTRYDCILAADNTYSG